jgi:nitrite reductase/ring-hydroxylating ferredoxin subunit
MVSQVPAGDVREPLCMLEAIVDGGACEAVGMVDGIAEPLVLLRRGAEVRAFLNVCPHAGRALNWAPGRFLVEDGLLVCAAHGAAFRIPDGYCSSGPCRGQSLREVPLRIADGGVYQA